MSQVIRTSLSCPACGVPFQAVVEQIIDVGRDPQAKARFLSGRVNTIVCPNCGHSFALGTPMIYHDPSKDLLIVFVPMQLSINAQERERVIGDLTRRVTESIPPEQRRAYLLQPRQAMTLPGMIDTILDADGITAEMREAQREKVRVMEMFLQVQPDAWPGVLGEQQQYIDHEFLQMILVQAENAAAMGHEEIAQGLILVYNFLIENTEIGREITAEAQAQESTVREVAERLQAMGEQLTREDFMQLVISYAGDDQRLQAVVGLMRPALDYQFFQELTARIDRLPDGSERAKLVALRERLSELAQIIDRQTQAVLQRAADTLRVILNSEDLDAAIRPRLNEIDDTFLAVLQANMQGARQQGDQRTFERLVQVQEKMLEVLQEVAPPHIKLINEVLNTATDADAEAVIAARAPQFGPELLDMFDAIAADLDAHEQPERGARLRTLRSIVAEHVGDGAEYDE